MKNDEFQKKQFQIADPRENYFECISSCDINDGTCVSNCLEILKKYDN